MCLEQSLVNHCSPTLAGIKVGSLYSFFPEGDGEFPRQYKRLRGSLSQLGLELVILQKCRRNGSLLLLIYRREALAAELNRREVQQFLREAGYNILPPGLSSALQCRQAVSQLVLRLSRAGAFPHEIGLFLGYPLEDVQGFVEHGGEQYLCRGLWKVYSNPESAQKTFRQYRLCTEDYRQRYAAGAALEQLVVASPAC